MMNKTEFNKKCILCFLLFAMFCILLYVVPTNASVDSADSDSVCRNLDTINGEIRIEGSISYFLDKYYDNGGCTEELIDTTSADYIITNLNEEDFDLLCRLVEAEVTVEDDDWEHLNDKVNVISVVINRVNSNMFPNTVREVILEKGQFSPVLDKRINTVKVSNVTISAIQYVINNGVSNSDALYFCSKSLYRKNTKIYHHNLEMIDLEDNCHYFFSEVGI